MDTNHEAPKAVDSKLRQRIWSHCSTHDNSADMLSREIKATQINNSRLFQKIDPSVDPQPFVEQWST